MRTPPNAPRPLPSTCRHPGCPNPRSAYTVFCDAHHQQDLDRVGDGAKLRPEDMTHLLFGPMWLNCLRFFAGSFAGFTRDHATAFYIASFATVATTLLGWRWSRRLIAQPDQPGYPIAFLPSPAFLIPLTIVSALIVAATFALARLARLVGLL
jgi:hypothetical protein